MSTQSLKRQAAQIACAALVGAASLPALANPFSLQFDGWNVAPPAQVSFSSTSPATSGLFNAGAMKFTATDQAPPGTIESFVAYCIELAQNLDTVNPQIYNTGALGSLFSASVQTAIAQLYSIGYTGSLANANDSAAFQLALWEITNETSGSYNLGAGSFQFTGTPDAISAQAGTLLGGLASAAINPNLVFTTWTSGTHQDFVSVTVRSTVPEPGSLALLGLGLAGLGVRRRRKN